MAEPKKVVFMGEAVEEVIGNVAAEKSNHEKDFGGECFF
jgi:hypothetical protein